MSKSFDGRELTFKEHGIPSAVPSGPARVCPIDGCRPKENGGWAFCEIDWRFESKIHMREKTHGLVSESEGRHEPIIQAQLNSTAT
jgi:hypothetical protein